MTITAILNQRCYALVPTKISCPPTREPQLIFYLKVVLLGSCSCSKKIILHPCSHKSMGYKKNSKKEKKKKNQSKMQTKGVRSNGG